MKLHLHSSAAGDFQPTRMLDRATYLGHVDPEISLFGCGCRRAKLWRKKRKLWMRLLPFLKLYWCEKCGLRVFRRQPSKVRAYPLYVPRFYR
jgi:hypothetical protein